MCSGLYGYFQVFGISFVFNYLCLFSPSSLCYPWIIRSSL